MVLLKVPHVYLPIVQFGATFSSGRSVFGEIAEIDVISETRLPIWEDARPELKKTVEPATEALMVALFAKASIASQLEKINSSGDYQI